MNKRSCRNVLLVIGFAVFSSLAHAQGSTYFVTAGDDATLAADLSTSDPYSLIVINQPVGGPYLPFTVPVTLAPNNSGTKIMAAPGEVAAWYMAGTDFTVTPGTADVVLENLVIAGPGEIVGGGTGVEVMGAPPPRRTSVKIINCQIAGKEVGVLVDTFGLAEIEGSRILNNGGGVVLGAMAGATVEKTQVRNNQTGIDVGGNRAKIKVWHSMVDANLSTGITVGAGSSAVLNNNDISFNGLDGVHYFPGSTGSVSFNTVASNAAVGVEIMAGATVVGAPGNNTVSDNGLNAIGLPPASNQIGP